MMNYFNFIFFQRGLKASNAIARNILFSFIFLFSLTLFGQSLQVGIPVLEEYARRSQLLGNVNQDFSFNIRPLDIKLLNDEYFLKNTYYLVKNDSTNESYNKKYFKLSYLPIFSKNQIHSGTPYPEVSQLVNSKGFQSYLTGGAYLEIGLLSLQIQPEIIFAQNLFYDPGLFKSNLNDIEYLERFGEGSFSRFLPGQSSLRFNFGAFSTGVSTENIWWGPGQFNSLIFSNNAFGFEHLTLNTRRPSKTFLGNFEGHLLVGRLVGSGLQSPISNLLKDDWRYLNAILISYNPKWTPGLFIGASRVFQQYNSLRGSTFRDYFPIFNFFQKERVFQESENSGEFDREGRDQQLTGFIRYVNSEAKAELYFEFGRRDHAFIWREAILNPEHARAYLFGFKKLIPIQNEAFIQVRGEVLQQQESINVIVRYPGIAGGSNWGGHVPVRHGFTHLGQMLGPGVGPSSNVQTLESAWVKGIKKIGVRLERLNRHQDIYTRRFNDPSEQGRWVDLSARILGDWQFNNLIVSSNINFVNSLNYQWQLAPESTPEFPRGENLFSIHSQVSLIYIFNKTNKSKIGLE